jgi:tRNA(fMet)-specific endonuclease VapC
MNGEIALDTSTAIRFLNGDATITARILALPAGGKAYFYPWR